MSKIDFTSDIHSKSEKTEKALNTIKGRQLLSFTPANDKLEYLVKAKGWNKTNVVQFDLPAAYTCPMASLCKAFANRVTGKMNTIPKTTKFVCYAARAERYPNVRVIRWHNYELLLNTTDLVALIEASLPKSAKIVRIHSAGEFYSIEYYEAWVIVAENHPEIQFFGYSKVLDYVMASKPDNFRLIYSYGGKEDSRRDSLVSGGAIIPTCFVVNSHNEAESHEVETICDNPDRNHMDFEYIMASKSFALLVH